MLAWHKMVESKLRRLNPTVYCGGDAMTLHVEGSIMPDFMIDGGSYPDLLSSILIIKLSLLYNHSKNSIMVHTWDLEN